MATRKFHVLVAFDDFRRRPHQSDVDVRLICFGPSPGLAALNPTLVGANLFDVANAKAGAVLQGTNQAARFVQ
jgi:hypothetical protein